MPRLLQVLVGILDHHDGRVHHGPDGDADERHDIGVDPLVAHDDERDQDAERQGDDGDEGGTQVE